MHTHARTHAHTQDYETLKEGPSEGVFVYGLYLDGCAWSSRENRMVDPEPKKLYNALPVLFVTGVLVRAPRWDAACASAVLDRMSYQMRALDVVRKARTSHTQSHKVAEDTSLS